jgi:hypothetical protein
VTSWTTTALQRTLSFQVAVFVLSFLLMLALPAMRQRKSAARGY